MPDALLYIIYALGGCALVWKGSDALDVASERLAAYYGLPPVVQGAVLIAIGSSFPELSTTVISTLRHGEFTLGVSAIVGSAIFNILVIPSISQLVSKEPLESTPGIVYKEALFYMLAVSTLMLTFTLSVIYFPSPSGDPLIGEMNRWTAMLPVSLYALYVFLQYQDTRDYTEEIETQEVSVFKEWGRMALGLLLILIGVEGLVVSAIGFGKILGTPSFFWGATVVAAGTSIPDAFASARAAKRGSGEASLANVLGSNTFDLLIALPAGILIAGTVPIDLRIGAPMMGVLTLATIVLFAMLRTHMNLVRHESFIALGIYAIFVIWMGLEGFEVVDLLRVQ